MHRAGLAAIAAAFAYIAGPAPELQAGEKKVKMLRPPSYYHAQPAYRSAAQPATRPAGTPRLQGHPIGDRLSLVYDRTAREFKDAIFYKPSDSTAEERDRNLAPLLVQEVADGGSPAPAHLRIGAVSVDASGRLSVDTSRPTVYCAQGLVRLGDGYCEQFTHLWATPAEEGKGVRWHGVRTTYGSSRWPLVWEVLSTESQPTVLYVSRSFEAAVEKQHGKPLQGRRSAAERPLDRQPNVVVARVLPDGKEPMGPMVYLDAAEQTVTTLLCRCMRAQVDNFVENTYYDMLPIDLLADVHVPTDGPFRIEKGPPATAPAPENTWLHRALRMPKQF